MNNAVKILVTLGIGAALAACGSSNDANKDNFEKAIQAKLDSKPGVCISIPSSLLGPRTTLTKEEDAQENNSFARELNALADAGLLDKKETQVSKFAYSNSDADKVPGYVFEVSDKGKKYQEGDKVGDDEFCTGKLKVTKIDNFTDPSEMGGMTISRVNYHYKVEDADDWIKNDKIAKAYEGSKALKEIKEENSARAVVIKTNDGWVEESQFGGGGF